MSSFKSAFLLLAITFCLRDATQAQERHFRPDIAKSQSVTVPLHGMDEIDFWSTDRVFAYRRRRIMESPLLAAVFFPSPKSYQPSSAVFGQIESGKPWWGILGINYHGSGMKSIDGPSEETRFLGNPFLLAGVIERWSYQPRPLPKELIPYFPQVESAIFNLANRRFTSRYDVTQYLRIADSLKLERKFTTQLSVVLYNARDLGFAYAELPPGRFHNVEPEATSPAFEIPQMLHAGLSSRYPGRANNMSPSYNKLDIRVLGLPARFDVRLWRAKPSVNQPPDMTCTLVLR